jgi:hypothetical protein
MTRCAVALLGAALLAGCGGNQALVASGGPDDFAAIRRISDEYGTEDAVATVPVTVNGEPYTFRVWIAHTKPRIMVQTASMAGAAAAGFVRGLTGGLVKGDQEYGPFEEAAISYLSANYGPGCTLTNSRKLTRIGWEWDFSCPPTTTKRK